MKKKVILFAIILLSVCSCRKTPVQDLCGSYSFKTGGYLELSGKVLVDTVFTRSLVPESGQLRIVQDVGDNVKVTMNILAGGPLVFDGVVDGSTLTLSPIERRVVIYREAEFVDHFEEALLKVRGRGEKFGNSLIIDMEYEGDFNLGLIPCSVRSSNVKCVAVENE